MIFHLRSSSLLILFFMITLGKVVLSEYENWPRREYSSKIKGADKNDVHSRPDGRIIFPSNDTKLDVQEYTPTYNPATCTHMTFCEDALNYPNYVVDIALRMNKDLKLLATTDSVSDRVIHRMDESSEDNSLCESFEKVVFPKVAKSKSKEWFFVANQENFKQGVRVELCVRENDACDMFDGFYEGYKTMCKQKYIYRQLVAITQTGQIKPETFRFPSSCCCFVKFIGDPSIRMGLSKHPYTSEIRKKA